jgi:hypothetical protein
VTYMAVAGCLSGAVLGREVDGLAEGAVWAVAGAILGLFIGVIVRERFAWVLESFLKGAIRGGGLFAAIIGLLLLIGLLAKQSWGGLENALTEVLMAAGKGVVLGGLLGAFHSFVVRGKSAAPPPKSPEWVVRIADHQQTKTPRRAVYDCLRKHRIPHPVASQKANGFHHGLHVEIPLQERQRAQAIVDHLRQLGLVAEVIEPVIDRYLLVDCFSFRWCGGAS